MATNKPCADGVVVIAISLFHEVPGSIREKEVPMNVLVCSCGSFVELPSRSFQIPFGG